MPSYEIVHFPLLCIETVLFCKFYWVNGSMGLVACRADFWLLEFIVLEERPDIAAVNRGVFQITEQVLEVDSGWE